MTNISLNFSCSFLFLLKTALKIHLKNKKLLLDLVFIGTIQKNEHIFLYRYSLPPGILSVILFFTACERSNCTWTSLHEHHIQAHFHISIYLTLVCCCFLFVCLFGKKQHRGKNWTNIHVGTQHTFAVANNTKPFAFALIRSLLFCIELLFG